MIILALRPHYWIKGLHLALQIVGIFCLYLAVVGVTTYL